MLVRLGTLINRPTGMAQPIVDLNFLGADTVPAAITFSRASSGTRITSSQLLETVSNNIGRIDHSLATGVRQGLLLESAATNSALYSRDLTNAVWTKTSANTARCEGVTGSYQYGPELVTNGTFDTDASGWTTYNANFGVSSGILTVTNTVASSGSARQTITLTSGSTYYVTVMMTNGSDPGRFRIGTAAGGSDIVYLTGPGTKSAYFTATQSTNYITADVSSGVVGATSKFDNISVREITNGAATTLTATANNALIRQAITKASHTGVFSAYVRRRTGSGAVTMFSGETTGPELVTNGDGSNGTSGWTGAFSGVVSENSGTLSVTGSSNGLAYQNITTTAGKAYLCQGTIYTNAYPPGAYLKMSDGSYGNVVSSAFVTQLTPTNVKTIYVATSSVSKVYVQVESAAGTVYFDNISVKELVETPITITSSFQRFSTTAATLVNPTFGFKLATNTDAIDVDYCQEAESDTSAIATTSAAGDRSADAATITLAANSDILVQDRAGGAWVDAQSAGSYSLAPRSGQKHIARLRAYPAGRLSASQKSALAVAAS